jgi:hypothetical protein
MPIDKLLFFGGLSSEGVHLDDFWEFDLNLKKWRRLTADRRPAAPCGTFAASMHATSTTILVCAGRSQRAVMRTLNMDLPVPAWKTSTGTQPSCVERSKIFSLFSFNR